MDTSTAQLFVFVATVSCAASALFAPEKGNRSKYRSSSGRRIAIRIVWYIIMSDTVIWYGIYCVYLNYFLFYVCVFFLLLACVEKKSNGTIAGYFRHIIGAQYISN